MASLNVGQMKFFATQKWAGVYGYAKGATPAGLSEVPFELQVRYYCGGAFRGTSRDQPPSTMLGPAFIKGKRVGRRVIWKKVYEQVPMRVKGADGASEYVGDYVARVYKKKVARVIWHPPVFYLGLLKNDQEATGTWHIRPYAIPLMGGSMLKFHGSSGPFKIWLLGKKATKETSDDLRGSARFTRG
jgi:hypothetical protein